MRDLALALVLAALLVAIASTPATAQTTTTNCRTAWNGELRCQTTPAPAVSEAPGIRDTNLYPSMQAGTDQAIRIAELQRELDLRSQGRQASVDVWELRDRANGMIRDCQRDRRRRTEASPQDCVAKHYAEDPDFVSGFFALLAELPGDDARFLATDIEARAAVLAAPEISESDRALKPYREAIAACFTIDAETERHACADAVVSAVPDRLIH